MIALLQHDSIRRFICRCKNVEWVIILKITIIRNLPAMSVQRYLSSYYFLDERKSGAWNLGIISPFCAYGISKHLKLRNALLFHW